MSKEITLDELEAHLREHFEEVKQGETIAIVQNGQTIAEIKPIQTSTFPRPDPSRRLQDVDPGPRPKNLVTDPAALKVIRHDPALRLQDFKPGERPKRLDSSSVDWLLDERERERSGIRYALQGRPSQ